MTAPPGKPVRLCPDCGGMHCYWCGRPMLIGIRQESEPGWRPIRRTREHLYRKGNLMRLSAGAVVFAHAVCNHERGHLPWKAYHEPGARDYEQRRVATQVRRMIAMLPARLRPNLTDAPAHELITQTDT